MATPTDWVIDDPNPLQTMATRQQAAQVAAQPPTRRRLARHPRRRPASYQRELAQWRQDHAHPAGTSGGPSTKRHQADLRPPGYSATQARDKLLGLVPDARVFPVAYQPGRKDRTGAVSELVRPTGWQHTTPGGMAAERGWPKAALVGWVLGDDWEVIDVDDPELAAQAGITPQVLADAGAMIVLTPSGGCHAIFRATPGHHRRSRIESVDGTDWLTGKRYIHSPQSWRPDHVDRDKHKTAGQYLPVKQNGWNPVQMPPSLYQMVIPAKQAVRGRTGRAQADDRPQWAQFQDAAVRLRQGRPEITIDEAAATLMGWHQNGWLPNTDTGWQWSIEELKGRVRNAWNNRDQWEAEQPPPPAPPDQPRWEPGQPIPIGQRNTTVTAVCDYQAHHLPSKPALLDYVLTHLWPNINQPQNKEDGARFTKEQLKLKAAAAWDNKPKPAAQGTGPGGGGDGPDPAQYADSARQQLTTSPDVHNRLWHYNPATGSYILERTEAAITRHIVNQTAQQDHTATATLINTVIQILKADKQLISFENPELDSPPKRDTQPHHRPTPPHTTPTICSPHICPSPTTPTQNGTNGKRFWTTSSQTVKNTPSCNNSQAPA